MTFELRSSGDHSTPSAPLSEPSYHWRTTSSNSVLTSSSVDSAVLTSQTTMETSSASSKSNTDSQDQVSTFSKNDPQHISVQDETAGCKDEKTGNKDEKTGCRDEKAGCKDEKAGCKIEITGCKDENSGCEDEEAGKDGTPAKLSFLKMPRRSKVTLLILAITGLCAGFYFSLPAPFYPREAAKKGASTTAIGLVFSSFQLVNFISAPLFGNFLTRIGAKFVFTTGTCAAGFCAILFGFLDQGPSGTIFIVMSFLVRSVEAIGVSAFTTASIAIITNEFPNHISSMFAIFETCIGVGLMVGPTLGGALYEVGGFGLPFWSMGAIVVLCGVMVIVYLPQPNDNTAKRHGSVLTLLWSPKVWLGISCVMVASIGLTFQDPTLATHLEQFDLSPVLIGLCFMIIPAFYAGLAPVWGYLSDRLNIVAPLLIGGNFTSAIGFLFLGPSPLLPFLPRELWTVIVGLCLFGINVGCAVVPTIKVVVTGARELGFPDNLSTFGLVAGLHTASFNLGAFIGPTLSGVLVENLGFYYAASIIALLFLGVMVACSVFFTVRRLRHHHHQQEHQQQQQQPQDPKTIYGEDQEMQTAKGDNRSDLTANEKTPITDSNQKTYYVTVL